MFIHALKIKIIKAGVSKSPHRGDIKKVNVTAIRAIIKLVIISFSCCFAIFLNVLLCCTGSGGCVCGFGFNSCSRFVILILSI